MKINKFDEICHSIIESTGKTDKREKKKNYNFKYF